MPGPTFLEGEDVTLRAVDEADVPFLQRGLNDPEVWRHSLGPNPAGDAVTADFYENVVADEDAVHCLICDGEEPMGHVSLTSTRYGPDQTLRARREELAYWLLPEYHGEGYGGDAARRMVRYAFEDRNMRRLDAQVGAFNEASAGLLESLGFEREGRLREATWFRGEYHDAYWYGLLREAWEG
jgi:ribosomal-protein-alanine N-acetyltransferase